MLTDVVLACSFELEHYTQTYLILATRVIIIICVDGQLVYGINTDYDTLIYGAVHNKLWQL